MLAVLMPAVLMLAGCTAAAHPARPDRTGTAAAAGDTSSCAVPVPTVRAHPDVKSAARVTTTMTAFAVRAWNPVAPAVRPSKLIGGLYVNYRSAWNGSGDAATETNVRTDGASDAQAAASPRHDPLTDLSVLRNLDALSSAGVRTVALDRLRCLLTPVTAAEFIDYGPPRGWVYEQLVDLAGLDPSGPWLDDARRFAETLARLYSQGLVTGTGIRPDWVAESASALIDAGARFARPTWTTTGRDLAVQLCQIGANPVTGLFPGQLHLDRSGHVVVDDVLAKVGSQAQLLDALLTAFDATHDKRLLDVVQRGLDSLISPSIGVMDHVRGGWFYAVDADGTHVRTDYKETRQAWLVPLFEHAANEELLSPDYATAMTSIVRDQLFQTGANGYVYRVESAWTPFRTTHGAVSVQEDWISSEATGIAVQALLGPLR